MLYIFFSLFILSAHAQNQFSCTATFDELNIPHQATQSMEEFYYCFGYHHAADRAWEMDYFRRVGKGRNAEVLGYTQLKSDLMMRFLDLPSLAEKLWNEFTPEKKKWLEYYSKGVNAGFVIGRNAQEFKDKKYEPEAWVPQDSLLVLLLQSFDQTRKTFFRDYEEQKNIEKWGAKAAELFDEDHMPWENTILKDGEYLKRKDVIKTTYYSEKAFKLWSEFPTVFGEESGSNNWVVSKKKSKTGKAILANDPHLDLKTPMFWYWIHLKSPEVNVIGGSVPGVPIIASGTNKNVSWGLTNAYLNAADSIFIKDLKDEDIKSMRPAVYVKLGFLKLPFFFKSFEYLSTGHRILPLEVEGDEKLVLRWTGFGLKATDLYPMFEMSKVKNVKEMDEVLSQVGVPAWNFVFADTHGDIGFRVVGRTYKHTHKLAYGVPTWTLDELQKEELLTPDERPHVLKPKREYVYTANNRHWPEDAYFYGGRGYSYSFRGFRIDELLQGPQNLDSFKDIQCDQEVVDARFFLPKLRLNLKLKELDGWNLKAFDNSLELPLYRRLMDLLMEKWEVNEYALYKLLDNLTIEQSKELEEVYKLAKEEVNGRSWAEIHRVNFPHMSKNNEWVFSPDLPGIGDTHSVTPGTAKWDPERRVYEQFSGASMRMIVEMEKEPKLHLILPGLNRDYTAKPKISPWEAWRKCEYKKIQF